MNQHDYTQQAQQVLEHWRHLGNVDELDAIDIGLVNKTFKVRLNQTPYILQRLHPVFAPSVHEDIFAVTTFLKEHNLKVPSLQRADDGQLCVELPSGCWRLQDFITGKTCEVFPDRSRAHEVGAFVAHYHAVLAKLQHRYFFAREEAHNTKLYLKRLALALAECQNHRLYDQVAPIAQEVLSDSAQLPDLWLLPKRHCHGDLKISNFMFDDDNNCIALVDWDTVGLLPWPMELGDSLRSWCNPLGEDGSEVYFDTELFNEAISGYACEIKNLWSTEEVAALIDGILVITLELTARFLCDALREQYFGYNANRYQSLGDHNLARAQKQWQLYKDVKRKEADLQVRVKNAFR